MTTAGFCGLRPLLFGRKTSRLELVKETHLGKSQRNEAHETERSRGFPCSFILMMELRKKIFTFRDILDLPPCTTSATINYLAIRTMKDLHNFYPEIIHNNLLSELKGASINKVLACFCGAMGSVAESWMTNQEWKNKISYNLFRINDQSDLEQLVEITLAILNCMIMIPKETFNLMDEDAKESDYIKILARSYSGSSSSCCASPMTPTSVLPEFMSSPISKELKNTPRSSPLLRSLRVELEEGETPSLSDAEDVPHERYRGLLACASKQKSSLSHMNNVDEEIVLEVETRDKYETRNKMEKRNQAAISVTSVEREARMQSMMSIEPTPSPSSNTPKSTLQSNTVTIVSQSQSSPSLQVNVVMKQQESPSSLPHPASPPPPPPLPPGSRIAVTAPPPPPPPVMSCSERSMEILGGPLMGRKKGSSPPPAPPPLGAGRALWANKVQTKLKRSSQMSSLYRTLKGKVEGGDQNPKLMDGRASSSPRSNCGKQGMADALAEMTKRSAYFQKIEEDAQKYAGAIAGLKTAICSFQTKDMAELLNFHKRVESILEHLTDETQVLARFEGFPQKKLEALRTAAVLFLKLNEMVTELQKWKIEAPLGKLLDKTERYFNKIKGDIDSLERTKDEEAKKFQNHSIHFDFQVLVQIKEVMVDVSSNCMELALKERKEAKDSERSQMGTKIESKNTCAKMLWRAFQFAFRVYTFAGGQDDRADKLTKELADEIETDRQQQ